MAEIFGSKGGGGSTHTPVEQDDSAQSMAHCRMLLALGEGEFAGGLDATRIFLDDTPLGNADGTMNFDNVKWDFRPGTQTQDHIPGFPAVENEISQGVDLTNEVPWVRAINNNQIDAVLIRMGFPALQQQKDNGDVVGSSVSYHIDVATDGGAYHTVLKKTLNEKLSALYELTHRINLPKANFGWQVRVVRDTPDSDSERIANKTQIQAYTEVIDARLRYPHTALLYVSFNAKTFASIPKISCKPKGRIVRVPSNYDPVSRIYNGSWNGTFKWAWTNNPAWIWFDILTEPRFGLGRRVTADMLDKWELYRIAQRCDEKVPDGLGGSGKETRFMFDVYIQEQNDAWQVIKDIAAGFNGMTFWGNNMFNIVSDMPVDESKVQILTRASVVGKPTYSSGSEKNRYSSALISYSDPNNQYQDATTAVMFPELVKQFKFKQTQITAIGCTRESEAQRRGGWAVYSNYLDRVISVTTGLDGYAFIPGTVFAFADERVSGRVYGGRVVDYDARARAVTVDRATSAGAGDTLMIRTQGGAVESKTIKAVNGTQLILNTAFKAAPLPDAVFVIDSGQLRLQYFRVTGLTFDDENNTFTITGAEYNSSKYDAVDNNTRLDKPPISLIPNGIVASPGNVAVSSYDTVRQGQRVATLLAKWDAPLDKDGKPQADIIAYQAQWKRDDNEWINLPQTGLRSFEVSGIYEGNYLVRVRAISTAGASSLWASSTLTHLTGRAGAVPKPVGLQASTDVVYGVTTSWGFPADTGDTLSTELQYTQNDDGTDPQLLAAVPYPQHIYQQMGLKSGQRFWYRARLVDRIGNQSEYTDWVMGESSSNAEDIQAAVDEAIRDSPAFQQIAEQLDGNGSALAAGAIADLENALANNENVERQYAQVGKNRAEIASIRTTVAGQDEAIAMIGQQITAVTEDYTAQISEVQKATATNSEAIANVTQELDSTVGDISARIQRAEETIANDHEALGTVEENLTSTIKDVSAMVDTKLTSVVNDNGTGAATFALRAGVQRNGTLYQAGLALGVAPKSGGGYDTTFLVAANQFGIYSGTDPKSYKLAFSVRNGETVINDAFIDYGAITLAKIGSFYSSNYKAGSTGTIMKSDGTFEVNGSTSGQGRMNITNNQINVYDANGRLRVRIGKLS